MSVVARRVTFVDLDERASERLVSVSARHEVVLADGQRVVLLDDRGWSQSGPPDVWAHVSVEDVADTARVVVGPDEPPAGRSHDEEAALYWQHLSNILRREGVVAGPDQLADLPHDVELSDRLRACIARPPSCRRPVERDPPR